jgi:ribosomal protein S18 acetylase RimI-like enzyme
MLASDLVAALNLTQAMDWSHRLADWEFHFRLGHGWVVCDASNVVVGTAMWWAYGDGIGTVGLVVVEASQQGRGIGRRLMDTILGDAGSRALRLVATPAGLALYQRCGFKEYGGIEQRQGTPVHTLRAPAPEASLRAMARSDLDAVVALDATAFGAGRALVLEQVLEAGSGVLAERSGCLVGFALIRPSGRGLVLGPVVADDETLAIALMAHHLKNRVGHFVRVDVPANAAKIAAWLEVNGLVSVDHGTTMVRGERPECPSDTRTFALVSQALH